jgi:hypothetical protein
MVVDRICRDAGPSAMHDLYAWRIRTRPCIPIGENSE